MLLVHVLATFPQLLVMDDVDIRTLFPMILHLSGVVLQPPDDQLLVCILIETITEHRYLFAIKEVLNKAVGTLPLLLVDCFQNHSLLCIRNVDLIFELSPFHPFKDCHVTNRSP